ncbi:MAG: hypothetical protein P1U36_00340 [Legionellaceae bacterium]|nr:hypothetical protein [Legionellaceae bacterium]
MALSQVQNVALSNKGQSDPNAIALNTHISAINQNINVLNAWIDSYNTASSPELQHDLLGQIQKIIKDIDNLQSNRVLAFCPDYFSNIHGTLFKEIQQEQQALGLVSQPAPDANITLSELIATMAPEKAQQMTDILSQKDVSKVHVQLQSLYQNDEPGKEVYDTFIKNHHIKFLGGGNSKNFLVVNTKTGAKQVLKVENRLGIPKQVESELREHALSSVLMPVHAERQVMYTHSKPKIGLTSGILQVVDYSAGQDLDKYCSSIPILSIYQNAKTQKILPQYQQMAEVLLSIQSQNCAFPDMKGSNWLVDEHDQLRVADGKSFIKLNDQGEVQRNLGFIYTPHMLAPEMQGSSNFSADAMHTYLLGKSLYQNLTGCSSNLLSQYTNLSFFEYSDPLFNTDTGLALKDLLSKMLNEDPAKRPPLSQVQVTLKFMNKHPKEAIKAYRTKEKCQVLLKKIALETGLSSPIVKHMQEKLDVAVRLQDYDIIYKDLETNFKLITKIKHAESHFYSWIQDHNINEAELGVDISGYLSEAIQKLGGIDSKDALLELDKVINPPHFKEILACVKNIKTHHELTHFGVKDVAMNEYTSKVLQNVNQALRSGNRSADLKEIYDDVKDVQKSLEKSKPITDEISDLVTQKKTFMSSKGKRVFNALVQVPLTERQHISKGESKEAQSVLNEMASSRILPQAMSSRTHEKDPASMFKAFKEKHQVIIEAQEKKKAPSPDEIAQIQRSLMGKTRKAATQHQPETQEKKKAQNELKDALNDLVQETPFNSNHSNTPNKHNKYDTLDPDEAPDSPTPKS